MARWTVTSPPLTLAHLLFLQRLAPARESGRTFSNPSHAAMCEHLREFGLVQSYFGSRVFGSSSPMYKRSPEGDKYVAQIFEWALVRGICIEGLPPLPDPPPPCFPPLGPGQ